MRRPGKARDRRDRRRRAGRDDEAARLDLEGVAHTVEVTASSLYEAVALGLASIRGNQWVRGIPDGFNPVKVRVTDVPVDHEVKLKDFMAWLDRNSRSTRETMDRLKIREILGVKKMR